MKLTTTSSAEVKNAWNFKSTPLHVFLTMLYSRSLLAERFSESGVLSLRRLVAGRPLTAEARVKS